MHGETDCPLSEEPNNKKREIKNVAKVQVFAGSVDYGPCCY